MMNFDPGRSMEDGGLKFQHKGLSMFFVLALEDEAV